MQNMKFDVENVRAYLNRNGFVFTVRGYDMENKDVYVDGVGVCERSKVAEVEHPDDLFYETPFSGFSNVDAWWDCINQFCKNKRKWLYAVRKKDFADKERIRSE